MATFHVKLVKREQGLGNSFWANESSETSCFKTKLIRVIPKYMNVPKGEL